MQLNVVNLCPNEQRTEIMKYVEKFKEPKLATEYVLAVDLHNCDILFFVIVYL